MNRVEVIGVTGLPTIKEGDDLAKMVCEATERQGIPYPKR